METINLVNGLVAFCHSDAITAALPTNIVLETAYAAGNFKEDPVRIPLNIASSVAFAAITAGALHFAGAESQELIDYAFAFGYAFPSAVRLVREIVKKDQNSGEVMPFALSATMAAGIGLVNMVVGSFDLYHFAKVDRFNSAMHFFGNALSQFGEKLPSLGERIKIFTK